MTKEELIAFEEEVKRRFEAGEIRGPIHLSGGNEDYLINIFKEVQEGDWVFSTWRNHYHALLHGVNPEWLMAEIVAGKSMNIQYPLRNFYTSAIVNGTIPIALGVAAAGKRTWCFIGDMAAESGVYHEAHKYAVNKKLPITFVIEDNGMSTNTPTQAVWGAEDGVKTDLSISYKYKRQYPHTGSGKWVQL